MQAAITWSKEEETQTANSQKPSTCVRVVIVDVDQASSTLTLEKLHEAAQEIVAHQEELYICYIPFCFTYVNVLMGSKRKASEPFVGSSKCQTAFDQLKLCLTSPRVLDFLELWPSLYPHNRWESPGPQSCVELKARRCRAGSLHLQAGA
ncbi:hypothetical protein QQF64_013673 [Cirrhinus molitorella]|uniref:Uncharacterized protein n=1 Tax=Cirrhinus molitorella TaxID=172907 RepID=A0ABR3LVD8_9TELE